VTGPNLLYCFPCPGCGELVCLPRQSPLGSFTASQYLCAGIWPILFLCHRLSSINEVLQSAIHLATELSLGQAAGRKTLWEIDAECCLQNCGKRHSIYTCQSRDTDPATVSRLFMSIGPRIACLGGHPAKFHRDRLMANRFIMS
jgi:hypothetical protein